MGLRRRIGWVMVAYGACLVAVLGLATFQTLTRNEDDVLSQRLLLEYEQLVEQLKNDPSERVPGGELETRDYVSRAWLDDEALPDFLRTIHTKVPASPTEYQEGELFQGSLDSFVMRRLVRLHGIDRWLTVWMEATAIEAQDVWPVRFSRVLLLGLVAALMATLGLSLILFRIVVNPLEELTRLIRDDGEESLDVSLREREFRDEIDELAGALSRSSARSAAFLKREQNFARNVSHELRTPIAVIQSALELAEARGDEAREPLRRIRRATERMSSTTEALLWLARERRVGGKQSETDPPARLPECQLADVVEDVFDLVRHLASGRGVTLVHDLPAAYSVRAPSAVLRVAIDNLVRNALDHSAGMEIRVSLAESRLSVSRLGMPGEPAALDSEPPFEGPAPSKARDQEEPMRPRGFGLQIVEEICERYGWNLEFPRDRGSSVVLDLRPSG